MNTELQEWLAEGSLTTKFFSDSIDQLVLERAQRAIESSEPWIQMEGACILFIHSPELVNDELLNQVCQLLEFHVETRGNLLLALLALPKEKLVGNGSLINKVLICLDDSRSRRNAAMIVGELAALKVQSCMDCYTKLLDEGEPQIRKNAEVHYLKVKQELEQGLPPGRTVFRRRQSSC